MYRNCLDAQATTKYSLSTHHVRVTCPGQFTGWAVSVALTAHVHSLQPSSQRAARVVTEHWSLSVDGMCQGL